MTTETRPRTREGPCHAQERVSVAILVVLLVITLTKETAVVELVSSSPRRSFLTALEVVHETKLEQANKADVNLNMTAGFIHIGKTGGSTLTGVIRNSCHSFVRKSGRCQGAIQNESIASELVTAYYHGT
jgi:hypothetical protein